MVRPIDPPRLTDRQVDVPESVRQLLRSAQCDTPSLSELASLKQKLTPLLNTPPAPTGLVGPLNLSSFAGLGKIVVASTLVVASGFAYWALQNRTTNVEIPSSSVDDREADYEPISTELQRGIDRLLPPIVTVPKSKTSTLDTPPKPLRSNNQTKSEVTHRIRAKSVRKGGVDTTTVPTADLQARADPSIRTKNAHSEMDEAELLGLARNALLNDPAQTLRLTFEHYRKFGTGVLGEEREVLIIEALVRLGRKDEAQTRTRNFLTVYPQSVYRRRLNRQVFADE